MVLFIASIGRLILLFLESTGRLSLFVVSIFRQMFSPPYPWPQLWRQFMDIGYLSLPVVGLTALFSGMVLALQTYTGFSRFSAEGAIATVVVLSMTRELGPVLAGLMVAGRIGAAMAAEIGTMRVTEQIDALVMLSTNPIRYLVVPRIIAGMIMLPLLVLLADVIGVFGGYLISTLKLGFSQGAYLAQTVKHLKVDDVVSGLIKASVFGFIISLMGCYTGFHAKRGAQGVGGATTNGVVSASILILICNYILTALLFDK